MNIPEKRLRTGNPHLALQAAKALAVGDNLRICCPSGKITSECAQEIREHALGTELYRTGNSIYLTRIQ